MGLIHVLDGIQGTCSGIMRSMGAQLIVSIFLFIAFYLIGLPVGLWLLLKTSVKIKGYFFGIGAGLIIIIIMEHVYLFRINWAAVAAKVSLNFLTIFFF